MAQTGGQRRQTASSTELEMLRSLTTYRSLALSLSRSAAVLALTLTGRRPGECNHNKRETPSSSIGVARGKAEYKTQTLTHTRAHSYTVGRSHSLTLSRAPCCRDCWCVHCPLRAATKTKTKTTTTTDSDGTWRRLRRCTVNAKYIVRT